MALMSALSGLALAQQGSPASPAQRRYSPSAVLPAGWMKTPVAEQPNNLVQLQHAGGKYIADVGQETFDVRITLDTLDGKIVDAVMHNPVVIVSKDCKDLYRLRTSNTED